MGTTIIPVCQEAGCHFAKVVGVVEDGGGGDVPLTSKRSWQDDLANYGKLWLCKLQ